MINFSEADLLSVLPEHLEQVQTEALSAAVKQGLQKLQTYSRTASVYAAIPELPDEILNLLAVELRTQYYNSEDSRGRREKMVEQTIAWYLRGGTGSVLTEYLGSLYQGGSIEEWFQYGGSPYFFNAYVKIGEEDLIDPSDGERVRNQISAYKNIRSWLESLIFRYQTEVKHKIEIHGQLEFVSEFYPRHNWAYLKLDGTWLLDGTYNLHRYKEEEQPELYPVALKSTSEIEYYKKIEGGLTVEKNLWHLDGTYLLDGEKKMDAEIIYYP